MAALSDFLESRLLEVALGQGSYQVPTLIRVTTVDDTATYTIRINEVDYAYPAVVGNTDVEILDGLATALVGAPDLTTTRLQDVDGVETLRIDQDASYVGLRLSVSATATGVLSTAQEVYAALFTTVVGDDLSGTEVADATYSRRVVPLAAVAAGASSNVSDVVFGPATGGFGVVTHAAILDASVGGNLLYHAALTTVRTVAAGDTFTFRAGDLTLSLA